MDINNTLVDTIKLSKTPVYGINVGQACSAGCFIYLVCHKKFAFPNAVFLVHQGGTEGISGSYNEVVSYIMEYQRKVDELEWYLKENTVIPEEVPEERITTEWFISVPEALEYKMVDKVVTSLDEVL